MRKTRLLGLVACIAVVGIIAATVAGCASAPSKAAAQYKAGTYTAKAKGIHGDVAVTVKFSDSAILEIKVGENEETAGIGEVALKKLPEEIVKGQTLDIDVVSGATVSSKALLDAVADCVKQAGGNVEALKSKKAAAMVAGSAIEKTADVVVIGGGGAGLSAAVSAAQAGAKVILIEKSEALGGNTIRAGGAYNAVDPKRQNAVKMTKPLMDNLKTYLDYKSSDFGEYGPTLDVLQQQIKDYLASGSDTLFDSIELHMIQTYLGGKRVDLKGNEIHGKIDLVRTLCTNSPKSIEWLESLGLSFSDNISTVLGALWPRTHGTNYPVGTGFIKILSANAEKLGVEIMLETKAEDLILDKGRVVGVKAKKTDGTSVTLMASKGVIMATGGFGANPEMRAKYNTYWPSLPLTMPTTNTPNATGDGIVMGEKAGADLFGMGFIQLMPSSHPVTGSLGGGVWGSAEDQVFVNEQGKRFVNEYAERDVLASAALKQTHALFYIICDKNTCGISPDGKNGWGDNIEDLVKTKSIYRADTLEGLEAQLGMPKGALVAQIATYNSYIDQGKDPDFGKANFGRKIEVGPFYATPRSPSVHHTMGGLAIDKEAHVLDKSGKVISGFYAAGETAGGVNAGNRLGGNAIPSAIVYGRIAGANAAAGK
jgi:fumarate reductase flavoprotein subunit